MVDKVKGGDSNVVEVSITQLSEHSKQAEFSPQMNKEKWAQFVAGVAKEGVLQPLSVTKGFKVIDGKNRLRAAKELGIENLRVIFEDVSEDGISAYIAETKLNIGELEPGQRAAIAIRLFHEQGIMQGKDRMSKGGRSKVSPTGETIDTHVMLAIYKKHLKIYATLCKKLHERLRG